MKMDRLTVNKMWMVKVDLHCLRTVTATAVVRTKIREAWECGCGVITFMHGAPDVSEWDHKTGQRGSIKWNIRKLIEAGEFDEWIKRPDTIKEVPQHLLDMINNDPNDSEEEKQREIRWFQNSRKQAWNDARLAGETNIGLKPNPDPLPELFFTELPPREYERSKRKKRQPPRV